MDKRIVKYLKRHAQHRELENVEAGTTFRNSIVIPVLDERGSLEKTLESLNSNDPASLKETLVILVINNSDKCTEEQYANNQLTLTELREEVIAYPNLNLSWIDASIAGREVTAYGGVGDARKIGMDVALEYSDWNNDPLLYCLDADTLVDDDYVQKIRLAFNSNKHPGAYLQFFHRLDDERTKDAIVEYELFMRLYRLGMEVAGSPYDYHAIGSAMIFRADAYVKAGGMKSKNGGEDFYFLQDVRKIGTIFPIADVIVYPSSRPSKRVDFGTGPKMNDMLDGSTLQAYSPSVFSTLRSIFNLVNRLSVEQFEFLPQLLQQEAQGHPWGFFESANFENNWPKMYKNTPKKLDKLQMAFNTWFDAFRTLKFVHYLEEDSDYTRVSFAESFGIMIQVYGMKCPDDVLVDNYQLLLWLRKNIV